MEWAASVPASCDQACGGNWPNTALLLAPRRCMRSRLSLCRRARRPRSTRPRCERHGTGRELQRIAINHECQAMHCCGIRTTTCCKGCYVAQSQTLLMRCIRHRRSRASSSRPTALQRMRRLPWLPPASSGCLCGKGRRHRLLQPAAPAATGDPPDKAAQMPCLGQARRLLPLLHPQQRPRQRRRGCELGAACCGAARTAASLAAGAAAAVRLGGPKISSWLRCSSRSGSWKPRGTGLRRSWWRLPRRRPRDRLPRRRQSVRRRRSPSCR